MAEPAPADQTARLEQLKTETLQLMEAGRYADAVPLAEEALRLTEAAHGPDDVHSAVAAHNLGFLQRRAGRTEEARQNLERALAIYERVHPAVHEDSRNAAGELSQIYLRGGRGEDAAALYAKLLTRAAEEGYGSHIGAGHLHNNNAFILRALGRPEASETEWRKATAIYSTTIAPDDDAYRLAIEGMLDLYGAAGRNEDARELMAETLTRLESVGQQDGRLALRLQNRLSRLELAAGRYAEARTRGEAALAIAEKAGEEASGELVSALNNVARAQRALANFSEAEALYRRAIGLLESSNDAANAGILNDNLAALLGQVGRIDEAERYNKRALQLLEQALGRDHKEVGVAAGNFGALLNEAGRYREAEPLLRRGLDIAEKQSPQDRVGIGIITDNLAGILRRTGRAREALAFSERAMALFGASLPANHPTYATALNNFGRILLDLGRFAEATEPLAKSHEFAESRLGADHVNTAIAAGNLGDAYAGLGDRAKAREWLTKALAALEVRFGASHSRLLEPLVSLGRLELDDGKSTEAQAYFERAAAIQAGTERRTGTGSPALKTTPGEYHAYFGLLEALWQTGDHDDPAIVARTSEIAQRTSISEAALALAALGARAGAGDPALAALTRQRQDLAAEWEANDEKLTGLLSRTSDRDEAQENTLRKRLGEIEIELASTDGELAAKFPRYGDLAQPLPLSIETVRSLLGPSEAAIQIAVGPQATHLWLISGSGARWLRLPVSENQLADDVRALRCGLDIAEWTGEGRARCQRLLDLPENFTPTGNTSLPFHTGRAHALFKLLFAPLGDGIKGKDLVLVASGPLTSLPFQVLITELPEQGAKTDKDEDFGKTAWLTRRHAITVLPSLVSLRPLRQLASTSRAASPFIGVGNPLLTGASGNDRSAWSRQSCDAPELPAQKSIEVASAAQLTQLPRGGPINLETLRRQPPLPETADELCTISNQIGAPREAVLLGENATESKVKSLSDSGVLGDARIVHFATHGLLAGETEAFLASRAEPALMLTPPDQASDADDGLLTASEVTGLKLDADWVVLSACNTASGNHVGAEALSGLARAFFYAGTRSLLVSHWAVESEATVELIVKSYEALSRKPELGHAGALKQAMLALIGKGGRLAHPAYWAPFVVVGGSIPMSAAIAPIEAAAAIVPPRIIPPLPQRIPASLRMPPPPAETPAPAPKKVVPPSDNWMDRIFAQ